jgi:hypothetical protein
VRCSAAYMIESVVRTIGQPVEDSVRAYVERGDDLARATQPILRHMLDSDAGALFGDEVLARIRGMQTHLARQMVGAGASDLGLAHDQELALVQALSDCAPLLAHFHAQALEWRLAERLEQQFSIDPVVPPLLQALISSPEPETQDLAMKLLAAQARWGQAQRRMQLPLAELPGELLHLALRALRSVCGETAAQAEAAIRASYDEASSRLGLAARLVTSMGHAAKVALDLRHGGSALFVTALSLGSGQPRDAVILSTHEGQATRLALELRAADLSIAAVEQQLVLLHGEVRLPAGFERLGPDHAGAILAEMHHAHR